MLSRGLISTFLLSRVTGNEFTVRIKDFSYKGKIYESREGSTPAGAVETRPIPLDVFYNKINQYQTLLQLYHKDGGLKKLWWYNTDSDNPIEKLKIEICDKGSGGGTVTFAYLDTPIEAEDFFILMFQGEEIYKGFVESDVDFSNPVVKLTPLSSRMKEIQFYYDYSSVTPFVKEVYDLIHDVIASKTIDSGIKWNPDKIDLGTVDPVLSEYNEDDGLYHVRYAHEYQDSIIPGLVERSQNRYYGIDIEDDFYIKHDNQDEVIIKLYNYENGIYKDVKVTPNDNKIKATEYAVYKKSQETSNTLFLGYVGNEGNTLYPPLEISKRLRKIQGKITVPDVLSEDSALQYAYAKLKQETKFKISIRVTGLNIEKYNPKIGDWIMTEGQWEKLYIDINNCEDTAGWTNSTISIGTGLKKSNCIKLFSINDNVSCIDLGYPKQWYKQEKISFFLKSAMPERTIEVGLTNDLSAVTFEKLFCQNSDVFDFHTIKYTNEFRYIVFRNYNSINANIFVDKIQVYCVGKKQYYDRVSKVQMDFSPAGIDCEINLGDITDDESDQLYSMERKIRIMETISQVE